jgi:hypothetical protein
VGVAVRQMFTIQRKDGTTLERNAEGTNVPDACNNVKKQIGDQVKVASLLQTTVHEDVK